MVTVVVVMLAVAAGAIGFLLFKVQNVMNPEPSPVHQRLIDMKQGLKQEMSMSQKLENEKLERLYKKSEYQNINLGQLLEQYPHIAKLKKLLYQAGVTMALDRFILMAFGIPIFLALAMCYASKSLQFIILVPVAIGVTLVVLRIKKVKRFGLFVKQFPDALGLMTSSLRAGHSFQASLSVVSSELKAPLSTEFSLVVRDINLGLPVDEALRKLLDNMDSIPDVIMFTTAVLIQREAGGNLAEVLDRLSTTIRDRFKLKGQIAALTGQSRLTGYILGAAPTILLLGLWLFMPGYVEPLFKTPLGNNLLFFGVVLQVIGVIVIRRIVDIRI